MNRKEFSPYFKDDDEVLFLDGNCLKVLSIETVDPTAHFSEKPINGKKEDQQLVHIKL